MGANDFVAIMIPLNERVSCPPAAFFLTFPEQLIGRRLLKMFRFQMDDSRGLGEGPQLDSCGDSSFC